MSYKYPPPHNTDPSIEIASTPPAAAAAAKSQFDFSAGLLSALGIAAPVADFVAAAGVVAVAPRTVFVGVVVFFFFWESLIVFSL